MKLVWHIVRKDLVRLRGWLAIWALVLIAKIAVGWTVRAGDSALDWPQMVKSVLTLTWLEGVMTFVLALLLMQEDRVMGPAPWWVTRPVAGGRLLAAKALGAIVALVGLPALITLPWWLACNFGSGDIAWALAELALWQLAIALPAMLVAALTDSLARAALWTLVLAMTVAASMAFWALFVATPPETRDNPNLVFWRALYALVVLGVAIAATIAVLFFTRRIVFSLITLGVGFGLTIMAVLRWPERWVSGSQMTEMNAERAAGVSVTFADASISEPVPPKKPLDREVEVRATAHGVPDGTILVESDFTRHVWRWANGTELEREWWMSAAYRAGDDFALRTALGLREVVLDPETERVLDQEWEKKREATRKLRQQQGLKPLVSRRTWWPPRKLDYVSLSSRVTVPASLAQRMREQPPAYEAKVWLRLLRPEIRWETPLEPGGWLGRGAIRTRIVRVANEHHPLARDANDESRFIDQVRLQVVTTRPATLREDWEAAYFARFERRGFPYESQGDVFCVIDRLRGQLDGLRATVDSVRIGSVQLSRGHCSATAQKISRDGQWVDWQPSWREGATLVGFGWHEEARFVRELTVEDFRLKP